MKKLSVLAASSAVALFALTGSAQAQVKIQTVVVSAAPTPTGTNIQVRLRNNSNHPETVCSVALKVKDYTTGQWRNIKVWTRPVTMKPHQNLALDFSPDPADEIQPAPDSYSLRVTCDYETAER